MSGDASEVFKVNLRSASPGLRSWWCTWWRPQVTFKQAGWMVGQGRFAKIGRCSLWILVSIGRPPASNEKPGRILKDTAVKDAIPLDWMLSLPPSALVDPLVCCRCIWLCELLLPLRYTWSSLILPWLVETRRFLEAITFLYALRLDPVPDSVDLLATVGGVKPNCKEWRQ